ncbi:unnamed protein product [Candidula unifasciata]|uniref:C2H2-type domain-containing protein n=1 Tax=Candidula unifasciata TaxID=100452 RepID=A0A8S3Z4E9_9EUPU|nr:unnamed protein product [Candidula unifasciata]
MAQTEAGLNEIIIHLVNPYRCGDCGEEFCLRSLYLDHLAEHIAVLKATAPCHQIVCATSLVEHQPNSTTITMDILKINDQQKFELQDMSLDYTELTPLKVLEQAGFLNLPRPLQIKPPATIWLLRQAGLFKERIPNLSELDSIVQQALFKREHSVTVAAADLCDAAQSLSEVLAPDNESAEFDSVDTRSVLSRRILPSVMGKENRKGVVCSICSHVFANARVLERHKIVHTGVRPYNCNVCFKEFNDVSSHRKHLLLHKRQHRCPVCHRIYLRRTQLLLHMKQHRKKRFIQFGNGFFEVQVNVTRSTEGQLVQEYTLPILQAPERTEKSDDSSMAEGLLDAKEEPDEVSARLHLNLTENQQEIDLKSNLNLTKSELEINAKSGLSLTESDHPGQILSDASTLEGQFETEQKKKTLYRCGHCKTVIFTRPTLFRHLIKHTNTRPFQCEQCLKSFYDKADLLHHHKTHTKPVQCRTCKSSFSKYLYLQNHLLKGCPFTANDSRFTVLPDLRCQCNICQKILRSKANILRHLRVHAFQERRKSSVENFNETSMTVENLNSSELENLSQNVEDHFQCLLNSVGYQCLICGQEFRFKSFIITHVRMHLNQRPYKCQECPKSFYARHLLKKHQQNHTKPYKCPACNKSFIRRYIMKNHFKKRHEQEDPLKDVTELVAEKLIQCDICGKTMKSYQKSVMLCHIRLHKDVRPFKCRVCDKSFISDNAVRKHSLNHTKPYKCHICSKGFSRRYLLTDHFRKKCSRKKGTDSKQRDDLVSGNTDQHGQLDQAIDDLPVAVLAISGEETRPYEAKIIKEQDIGTGTVTYTCEPCDKRFTVYEALMRHINTFSKATPCKYCRQVFGDKHVTMLHQRSCLGLAVSQSQKCSKKSNTVGKQQEKVQKIMKDISMKIENLTSKTSSNIFDEDVVEESVDSTAGKNDSDLMLLKKISGDTQEQSVPVMDMLGDTQVLAGSLKDLSSNKWVTPTVNTVTNILHSSEERKSQFSCPECDRSFATTRGLKIHASSHVRLFKCETCDKDFTQISDLRAHANSHITGAEAGEELKGKLPAQSLNKHQQNEEKKQEATAYNKKEQTSSAKSVVSEKRSRKTSISKKGDDDPNLEKIVKHQDFKDISRRLMQSGTRGRPYSCKMCRRRFTEQSGLDVHLLQNHGVRP